MRRTSVLLWALTASLAACGGGGGGDDDGSGPPPTGGARGAVMAGTTGVQGVAVTATKGSTTKQATTGANGQYNFTGLEVGSWTISITAPNGYALANNESGSRTVSVTANAVAEVGTMQLVQSGGNGGDVINVDMQGTQFNPQTVTITRGQSVRWTNRDNLTHNATGSSWSTPNLSNGQSATVQFNQSGTFQYECTFHNGMTGTVVVQ